MPDGGVVGAPGGRHESNIALCTTAYTVWPARVRGHLGPSDVGSDNFGGLLYAASPACEFNAWPFPTASQLGAAATGQRAPDCQGEQQSGAAFLLSFTDPIIHSPQPCAATATLRWRLLWGRRWHPSNDVGAASGGALPSGVPTGSAPHLQAATPNRLCSDNLAVARGEEGDCTGECLQGVCGGRLRRGLLLRRWLQEMC